MAKRRYHDNGKPMSGRAGGMINDDRSAPCNLPRNVMEKEYGYYPTSPLGMIDDLYSGVERQLNEDHRDAEKVFKPKKY